jgi:hypothetical protein
MQYVPVQSSATRCALTVFLGQTPSPCLTPVGRRFGVSRLFSMSRPRFWAGFAKYRSDNMSERSASRNCNDGTASWIIWWRNEIAETRLQTPNDVRRQGSRRNPDTQQSRAPSDSVRRRLLRRSSPPTLPRASQSAPRVADGTIGVWVRPLGFSHEEPWVSGFSYPWMVTARDPTNLGDGVVILPKAIIARYVFNAA